MGKGFSWLFSTGWARLMGKGISWLVCTGKEKAYGQGDQLAGL